MQRQIYCAGQGHLAVATKQGLAWNAALSKHPKRAVKEIYEGAKRAAGSSMGVICSPMPSTHALRIMTSPSLVGPVPRLESPKNAL